VDSEHKINSEVKNKVVILFLTYIEMLLVRSKNSEKLLLE